MEQTEESDEDHHGRDGRENTYMYIPSPCRNSTTPDAVFVLALTSTPVPPPYWSELSSGWTRLIAALVVVVAGALFAVAIRARPVGGEGESGGANERAARPVAASAGGGGAAQPVGASAAATHPDRPATPRDATTACARILWGSVASGTGAGDE